MKSKNILVPFDGSDHATKAMEASATILKDFPDTRAIVLTVVDEATDLSALSAETGLGLGGTAVFNYIEADKVSHIDVRHAMDAMAKAGAEAYEGVTGDRVKYATVVGPDVATAIAGFAKDNGADMIVMGRRGVGGLRGLLGGVAKGVQEQTDIPVLTVK